MSLTRRSFIKSMLVAAAAPAIVRAESIMRITAPRGLIETSNGVLLWGDGVHDDTAGLQAILDGKSVLGAYDGLPVLGNLRYGVFKVTSPLIIGAVFSGRTLQCGKIEMHGIAGDEPVFRCLESAQKVTLSDLHLERVCSSPRRPIVECFSE
ncbi:MAG: hypothetical protein M0Z99_01935 [Betaproteobacteria bacterium]|nr:hypothetical protein [Betaproteobacteria bacterium]